MKAAPFTLLVIVIALVGASFCAGFQWCKHSEHAAAEDQAVWVARTWTEGISIDELCRAAGDAGKVSIPRDGWDAGSNDDVALGPMVSGRRVCVKRDRSIYWRTAR